ncbi:phenol hydroxylase subunit [Sulfurimonas sp.]|uniref:phenol hydroxylase subunit n=1 Tax=Sulfurimonas sp. TaxID=2022749 RepID=UPI002B47394B|nr:phenol hydroxylase subunit [Sulfurimonas sp.]
MNELMPGNKKFIKVENINSNGFVEFIFAIDYVTTNVEFILPYKAFIEFCQINKVSFVNEDEEEEMKNDDILWKYGTEEFRN